MPVLERASGRRVGGGRKACRRETHHDARGGIVTEGSLRANVTRGSRRTFDVGATIRGGSVLVWGGQESDGRGNGQAFLVAHDVAKGQTLYVHRSRIEVWGFAFGVDVSGANRKVSHSSDAREGDGVGWAVREG